MCGVLGIASSAPVVDRSWLVVGRDAMRHRGPDDAGEWWSSDGRVGMAHRRLAIIDLSPNGHQPMHDTAEELVIVYNGEIYNYVELRRDLSARGHSFHSDSDTEVILAAYRAWGSACLARLNGMFAFAVYDRRDGTLFMARDRAGEKPLYYAIAGGALRFASELKALLADPSMSRRIDREALDCYLAMGFVAGERCMLQGVRKLPPAHAMLFDTNTTEARVWRYWDLPDPPTGSAAVEEQSLVDELESLLEDAVRRQLVADVPVGVLLSGGVDSSLVTSLAARASAAVNTYTVRFPGYDMYDETVHARLIAHHFGTHHTELEAAEIKVGLLPVLARQFDEPMADSSMIPTHLVSSLIRKHCTVALGGDGGDELFAGYPHYNRLLWTEEKIRGVPRRLRGGVAALAGSVLPIGFKGRVWLQGLDTDFQSGLPLIASQFDRATRCRLLQRLTGAPLVAEHIRERRVPQGFDLVQRATRMDFENYLPEDILVKVDRASMLASLEVRSPFLDHRVVEFAFGRVPSNLKASSTRRKILLKKLAARLLPPAFDQQRKQGFSIPLPMWLRGGPWREFFKDVLLSSGDSIFDKTTVLKLLRGHSKGRANGERLFALVMFELWRREYRASL